jgi:hypothetical protein
MGLVNRTGRSRTAAPPKMAPTTARSPAPLVIRYEAVTAYTA